MPEFNFDRYVAQSARYKHAAKIASTLEQMVVQHGQATGHARHLLGLRVARVVARNARSVDFVLNQPGRLQSILPAVRLAFAVVDDVIEPSQRLRIAALALSDPTLNSAALPHIVADIGKVKSRRLRANILSRISAKAVPESIQQKTIVDLWAETVLALPGRVRTHMVIAGTRHFSPAMRDTATRVLRILPRSLEEKKPTRPSNEAPRSVTHRNKRDW